MSSCYSSKRSSLRKVEVHEVSKSVPETPAQSRLEPVFRTVPESPEHNPLLSDDDDLDIEILTHKLELHQLELEEAELRCKQRQSMKDKQAADVAAAARFRDGLDRHQILQADAFEDEPKHVRSSSLQSSRTIGSTYTKLPPRSTSLRRPHAAPFLATNSPPPPVPTLVRSKRPVPLLLSSASVAPQEVQSAALPVRRNRDRHAEGDDMKRNWRRTTIAAGRNSGSKIILMTSPGKVAEYDFVADIPPVPQLSTSESTTTSPTIMSPITPLPTEDQIRRELETFALEEGPNLQLSRRSSVMSRMPAAFVPDVEDKVLPTIPTALADVDDDLEPRSPSKPNLSRKKSFFSRFEKKNDVDALLNLYMTDEQLVEEKMLQRKTSKTPRQTFFKRWQYSDTFHKVEKPR